ncbi:MAG: ABC transporter permease, partial [Planctomycetota bacterium]
RIEGLAISTDERSNLVEFVASGDRAMEAGLVAAGMSDAYVARFYELSTHLQVYRAGIDEGDASKATAAADSAIAIVTDIEAASRNSKIMIVDASEELRDKVGERIGFVQDAEARSDDSYGRRDFHLGTDPIGRDVLTQMMHACRLSISIGLVSTGISVVIGIVIGSLMGYFGGWVDLVLSRVVEIFMAIPVLFLLIVAASALPRNTYVMMAIIGCVTWTGSARFIRAEFLKLRNQDFVQSCRAVGLPLHSTLFRHMLPNGITPVLVQASFGIAAAIIAEATLSYLGLGPYGQSSWGKLLSLTTGETGVFLWWMAVFPGVAIFLTVLAYNVLGENFRDAIDPKMRKAAH